MQQTRKCFGCCNFKFWGLNRRTRRVADANLDGHAVQRPRGERVFPPSAGRYMADRPRTVRVLPGVRTQVLDSVPAGYPAWRRVNHFMGQTIEGEPLHLGPESRYVHTRVNRPISTEERRREVSSIIEGANDFIDRYDQFPLRERSLVIFDEFNALLYDYAWLNADFCSRTTTVSSEHISKLRKAIFNLAEIIVNSETMLKLFLENIPRLNKFNLWMSFSIFSFYLAYLKQNQGFENHIGSSPSTFSKSQYLKRLLSGLNHRLLSLFPNFETIFNPLIRRTENNPTLTNWIWTLDIFYFLHALLFTFPPGEAGYRDSGKIVDIEHLIDLITRILPEARDLDRGRLKVVPSDLGDVWALFVRVSGIY